MKKYTGKMIKIDGQIIVKEVFDGMDYVDDGFIGSEYRIETVAGYWPINIKEIGKENDRKIRIQIEFVQDCEESQICEGILFT